MTTFVNELIDELISKHINKYLLVNILNIYGYK